MFWGPRCASSTEERQQGAEEEGARADGPCAPAAACWPTRTWPGRPKRCRKRARRGGAWAQAEAAVQPLRVAVCGNMVSPPLFEASSCCPREDVLARIDYVTKEVFSG
ncbi:MAG: hypothetical protein ACLSVD_11405 [Eggerthellaceae bacterium]